MKQDLIADLIFTNHLTNYITVHQKITGKIIETRTKSQEPGSSKLGPGARKLGPGARKLEPRARNQEPGSSKLEPRARNQEARS
jgi:hypothetical protein